mmetsp:Transcript_28796/g.66977  ORF Transcript_28796/g.66977 Transcript_28796/m.66977 type:complete len:264 (-) Transcript_28796:5272-6063(-)
MVSFSASHVAIRLTTWKRNLRDGRHVKCRGRVSIMPLTVTEASYGLRCLTGVRRHVGMQLALITNSATDHAHAPFIAVHLSRCVINAGEKTLQLIFHFVQGLRVTQSLTSFNSCNQLLVLAVPALTEGVSSMGGFGPGPLANWLGCVPLICVTWLQWTSSFLEGVGLPAIDEAFNGSLLSWFTEKSNCGRDPLHEGGEVPYLKRIHAVHNLLELGCNHILILHKLPYHYFSHLLFLILQQWTPSRRKSSLDARNEDQELVPND